MFYFNAAVTGNLASPVLGIPEHYARRIPEYDTHSEYGIPNYSPWVILHRLDGAGVTGDPAPLRIWHPRVKFPENLASPSKIP